MRHLPTAAITRAAITRAAITRASVAAAPHVHLWKSPVPYLFGGLALTMLLIAGALIVLACTFRKQSPTNSSGAGEKDPTAISGDVELQMEPKILVIMAGNHAPTYLATRAAAGGPLCCSCSLEPGRKVDKETSS